MAGGGGGAPPPPPPATSTCTTVILLRAAVAEFSLGLPYEESVGGLRACESRATCRCPPIAPLSWDQPGIAPRPQLGSSSLFLNPSYSSCVGVTSDSQVLFSSLPLRFDEPASIENQCPSYDRWRPSHKPKHNFYTPKLQVSALAAKRLAPSRDDIDPAPATGTVSTKGVHRRTHVASRRDSYPFRGKVCATNHY